MVKSGTVEKYLLNASRLISGFTGEDPRKVDQQAKMNHFLVKGVIDEIERFEKVPDKREPHTPAMQFYIRENADSTPIDSLESALADGCGLGLVLGPRITEWAQSDDAHSDPLSPELAPNNEPRAFTLSDVDLRGQGDQRVSLEQFATMDDTAISSAYITFSWQKNGRHGERKLVVRNDSNTRLCPVRNLLRMMRRYQRLMGGITNRTSPLSVYQDSNGTIKSIVARDVTAALRQAAATVYKINPDTDSGKKTLSLWSTHSIRVGACVALHVNGISGPEIKFLLRWNSDAFMDYLRNLGTLSLKQNAALNAHSPDALPNLF